VSIKQLRVLAIVATDRTYEAALLDGERVWVGKCIHCGTKLTIADDGTPISRATIEHIWPRNHGGENELQNIALACAGCNRSKSRHDRQHRADPRLAEVVEELRRKRTERWRNPAEVGLADRLARILAEPAIEADGVDDDGEADDE
jgi:5-methylcytosine-specific restriction endonuclease McrA